MRTSKSNKLLKIQEQVIDLSSGLTYLLLKLNELTIEEEEGKEDNNDSQNIEDLSVSTSLAKLTIEDHLSLKFYSKDQGR